MRDDRHAEGACLTGETRTVVVGPKRRRRQRRMKLAADLSLRERILIRAARRCHHNACARARHRLHILREFSAMDSMTVLRSDGPLQMERSAGGKAGLKKSSPRDSRHSLPRWSSRLQHRRGALPPIDRDQAYAEPEWGDANGLLEQLLADLRNR